VTSGSNDPPSLPLKDQVHAIQPETIPDESRDTGADKPLGASVSQPLERATNIPQPPPRKNKSARRCREGREWIRLGVEVLTLIVVGIYAVINDGMYSQMVWQNKQARQQFKAAQRPYVTIGRPDGTFMAWKVLHGGQAGIVTIYFQNIGNTIARNFHVWAWLSIGFGIVKLPLDPTEPNHPVHNWPIQKLGPEHRSVEHPPDNSIGAHSIWIDYAYSQRVLPDIIVNSITSTDIPVAIFGFYEYSTGRATTGASRFPLLTPPLTGKILWKALS
jgi:hypothetical protein